MEVVAEVEVVVVAVEEEEVVVMEVGTLAKVTK